MNLEDLVCECDGCDTLEGEREVIGRMFVEQKFEVLVLSETKLKGKGDCEFGCVSLGV